MDNRAWAKVVREANLQLGVIASYQLNWFGLNDEAIRWRVQRGDLVRMYAGVYRLAQLKASWDLRARAALERYGSESALCLQTAARVWWLDHFRKTQDVIHLAVPRGTARPGLDEHGVFVHSMKRPFFPQRHGKLRVTELPRTILDLAPTLKEDTLDDLIDSAQRDWPDTDRLLLEEVGGDCRGIDGAARVRALLEERGGLCTDSPLENRGFRVIRRSSLPRPKHQLHVFDAYGYIVRVDFAWPLHRVALHVDSFLHHSARTRFEHDRNLMNRLSALGWHSMFVTSRQLDEGVAWLRALSEVLAAREPQRSFAFGGTP
jgi:hypothetical protein